MRLIDRFLPQRPSLSWWIVVGAGALTVFFSIAITREIVRSRQVRVQVQRLRDQVFAEQRRHAQLTELITYLGSQTFQEREARLKLGLRKPGERVLVVPPGSFTNSTTATANTQTTNSRFQTNPERWWEYFFGQRTDQQTQSPS